MDGEIEFGEVQQAKARAARRPDADLHYAVEPYGSPEAHELPIFVDLDVVRDIEEHAASDTTVELGGVMLGGQFHDDDGRPFVVVTDCLRAQHYESTKGSFKFTHETWAAISRQRDEFPAELQMVGWYHTHPDWGVFLSGMDMFICDHFFNKPLDVAYVVDPCRGDRGMFQWLPGAQRRTRRTSGFYITASRFRAAELRSYVEQLAQKGQPMPAYSSGSGGPVVHVTQPPPPAWHGVAVWGTLVAQFCLLAVIAWRLLEPPIAAPAAQTADAAAVSAEREAAIKTEFLDRVLGELRGTEEGFAERMEQQFVRSRELQAQLEQEQRQNLAVDRERDIHEAETRDRLNRLEGRLTATTKRLEAIQTERDSLRGKLAALDNARRAAAKAKGKTAGDDGVTGRLGRWPYAVGGGIGILAVVCLVLAVAWRKRGEEPVDRPVEDRPQSPKESRPAASAGETSS